jgi:hypothetical protein
MVTMMFVEECKQTLTARDGGEQRRGELGKCRYAVRHSPSEASTLQILRKV